MTRLQNRNQSSIMLLWFGYKVSIMLESIKIVWVRYIRNATFHGLRYLAEPGLHWTERWFYYNYGLLFVLYEYRNLSNSGKGPVCQYGT